MKKSNIAIVLCIVLTFIFINTCSNDDHKFKLCPEQCPSTQPWRVESLDLKLPCFSTQEACLEWAKAHGYSDKTCIKCD